MPTAPPSITALPSAPDPNNRSTFNALAYPWSAALPTFGTEVSAVATNVKANADEAQADAVATAADRIQTGLDVVATAADRVQTDSDRTSATNSAAAAAASAAVAASAAAFLDTNPVVKGSVDATKQVRFEVDGLTTATTRVLTVPDADLTLVGVDTAQTLTNKTLSGATNNVEARSIKSATTTVSVSGAAAPTAGQVLKATGPTAAAWQTHAEFATGTAMLFAQTAAPTGWTKSTTHDNKALRVVSGTAGSGGSTAFTTVFASRTPAGSVTVDGTTLTESQIPAHTHTTNAYNSYGTGSFDPGGSSAINYLFSASITSSSIGGGGSHTHTGSFTGTAMDFAVQYVDVIIATKD